jgi:hypothetical protein
MERKCNCEGDLDKPNIPESSKLVFSSCDWTNRNPRGGPNQLKLNASLLVATLNGPIAIATILEFFNFE